MKNRIVEKMRALRENGGKSFSVVLMIGDPDTETTDLLVKLALESNVAIVELGIPYQDPFLDSQVMRESMQRALTSSNDFFMYMDYLKHIRDLFPQAPFEVMVYYDTVMKIGLKRFAKCLKDAQMDAVLVADYVLQDEKFLKDLDSSFLDTNVLPIRFLPHPFSPQQMHDLQKNGQGFIIMQTVASDSGERTNVLDKNYDKINLLRENGIEIPVVFAYGIRTPEDIRKCIKLGADGGLLGTIILDAAYKNSLKDFRKLLLSLRKSTSNQP